MSQERTPHHQSKKLSPEQETIATGIIVWGFLNLFLPILGIPITWLGARKLRAVHKIIASGAGMLPIILVAITNSSTPEPSVVSSDVQSTPVENNTSSLTENSAPKTESRAIQAIVQRKGIDFSYEVPGTVQKNDTSITVIYIHSRECGANAASSVARQEWQAVFDLETNGWTHKVRELTSCFFNASSEWIDDPTSPSQFTIETFGDNTVIKADSLNTDGSVIVDDAIVVTYNNKGNLVDFNAPAVVPEPLTEAEQFKQIVISHTDGLFAIDRINSMPTEELYAYRQTLGVSIQEGLNGGLPLEYIKLTFADKLQIQHGMDEQLANNLSSGLIDGILAWNRGERPNSSLSTQEAILPATTSTANHTTAEVYDPPSNVRLTPNGEILCSVGQRQVINIYGSAGDWYYTDACGQQGVIHSSQIRF